MAGEMDPLDDVDYFRFELEQRATVVVAVTGAAGFGALLDADGEVLSELERIPERSRIPAARRPGRGHLLRGGGFRPDYRALRDRRAGAGA